VNAASDWREPPAPALARFDTCLVLTRICLILARTGTGDNELLTEERRLALQALAHFYLGRNSDDRSRDKARPLTQAKWFNALYGVTWKAETSDSKKAKKDFDNFLRTAAPKGVRYVHDDLRKRMANANYFDGAPAPIQHLITAAFDYHPDPLPRGSALSDVADNLSRDDRGYWPRIAQFYAGNWDVYRYSAHGDEGHPGTANPRVMRAAMKVFEPHEDDGMPRFQIDYRPQGHGEPLRTSRGAILSLGKGSHMQFVGWEAPRRYPMNIVAAQAEDGAPKTFLGLVTRYHEQNFFFAARVLFVRSSERSLVGLDTKIGMHRKNEVREMFQTEHPDISDDGFDDLMNAIRNRVGAEGMSGLRLGR
jgi:hypothetical protein